MAGRSRVTATLKARQKKFSDALQGPDIDLGVIRHYSFQGIPDGDPTLRPQYWKILLGYLPLERSQWESTLKRQRELYRQFKKELIVDPRLREHADKIDGEEEVEEKERSGLVEVVGDHPLSLEGDSVWAGYFEDAKILAEIRKDVYRTFPDMHFFNAPETSDKEVSQDDVPSSTMIGDRSSNGTDYDTPICKVAKMFGRKGKSTDNAMENILFLYVKLNPGVGYVQGMNEIMGPLFYVFGHDTHELFRGHVEADTFFCFTALMSEIRDRFVKTLDREHEGVMGVMMEVNSLLKELDFELWKDLEEKKMHPQFYTFRWLTLLMTQDFELPDLIRLWDSLFADPKRFEFLNFFCVAMIMGVRNEVLEFDFSGALKLLQAYPACDINQLCQVAAALRHDKATGAHKRRQGGV